MTFGTWTDRDEEALRNWKIELAVGASAVALQNEMWTWGSFIEMVQGPLIEPDGLAEFYAGLAGRRAETVPEVTGGWYHGVVSDDAGAQEPAGGSLLAYDFEGADPVALSRWLAFGTVFDAYAWCLFTLPNTGHLNRLRFVAPLNTRVSLREWRGVHGVLLEYFEDGVEDRVFSAVRPSPFQQVVMPWPATPRERPPFFHSHSGMVFYADTVLECHPGWEGLDEVRSQVPLNAGR